MISIYLKRLILSTAFISLVYFFLQEDINNISRLLEKYKDTPSSLNLSAYSVVIQAKPVDGIKENLSGLTWSAKHGMLFAVINNPPEIVWITTEGKLTGKFSLPDIKDPEAIAWAGEDSFWIGSAKWHLNRSQFGIRIDHDLASISDHSLASQSITIWHTSDH